MNFTFAHNNLNVYDLEKSLDFYQKALNLKVEREKLADDESFKLVYLTDGVTPHLLELTWLRDMDRPYELGDNEIHLAFAVDDFDAAYIKRWDVSASKIHLWEFILLKILTDTGWKLYRANKKSFKKRNQHH